MPSDIHESLKILGLTKYEASVYIALLGQEGATATEIHERSGVPRASVYPTLDRLIQKRLANVSHTTPRRFSGVPPDEGIDLLLGRIEEQAILAREELQEIYRSRQPRPPEVQEMVWSISGEEAAIARMKELILTARERVTVASRWPFLRDELLCVLDETPATVEIFTNEWEPDREIDADVYLLPTTPYHHDISPAHTPVVCIVDDHRAMLFFRSDTGATALYSESHGLLSFLDGYLGAIRAAPDHQ
ncbi:MAG: TrmB family transcriptional regulator [Methanomicrobiales archaeon]